MPDGTMNPANANDTVHPNAVGYGIMEPIAQAAIVKALKARYLRMKPSRRGFIKSTGLAVPFLRARAPGGRLRAPAPPGSRWRAARAHDRHARARVHRRRLAADQGLTQIDKAWPTWAEVPWRSTRPRSTGGFKEMDQRASTSTSSASIPASSSTGPNPIWRRGSSRRRTRRSPSWSPRIRIASSASATSRCSNRTWRSSSWNTRVKKLDLRGFIIGANVNGGELANPKFDPFWKKAEELGTVVLHPSAGFDDRGKRLDGAGALGNNIGFPLDTTIALAHLIFEGVLDRFAGVRIVAAHGGGFLAATSGGSKLQHASGACQKMKRKPSDYLRGPQLYFDSLVYSPQNVRNS